MNQSQIMQSILLEVQALRAENKILQKKVSSLVAVQKKLVSSSDIILREKALEEYNEGKTIAFDSISKAKEFFDEA